LTEVAQKQTFNNQDRCYSQESNSKTLKSQNNYVLLKKGLNLFLSAKRK